MSSNVVDQSGDDAGKVLIYHAADGGARIDAHLCGETVWVTQQQMAELLRPTRQNAVQHVRNIYDEAELKEEPSDLYWASAPQWARPTAHKTLVQTVH